MNCKSLMFGGLLSLAAVTVADAAVVTGDLNLRNGPGTGYRVIDTMPAGSYVDILGCTGSWCEVAYGGITGYASASYLGGGTQAYAAEPPVYVAPPVYYSRRVYRPPPPVFGFGFGFGPRWHHWY